MVRNYKGYVANITETCDPENELQLVTKVQVAPNNVDDTRLLDEALPELRARTELEMLYTDGGYGSPETDDALRENEVEQIQTAIRGRKSSAEKRHLSLQEGSHSDFEIKQTEEGKPTQITCPQGQTDPNSPGRGTESESCGGSHGSAGQASLPGGKVPVRGQFRVTCMILGSAVMGNIRRIQQYKTRKAEQIKAEISKREAEGAQVSPFCSFFDNFIRALSNYFGIQKWVFGC